MQYRKFGKLDWQASALGFGTMRLPVINNVWKHIDEEAAIRMLRYAIDSGVNYVDTAYVYHGGNSELLLGKALQDGYRTKTRVATKMPSFLIKSRADFDRIFGEQLERLQTDNIDYYLLHGLDKDKWPLMRDFKIFDWAEKKMAKGQIGYLGFSFHDDYPVFKEIVDYYDSWTFCQIQYNYMDEKFQAGSKGLRYAAGKGLAVVIMEPIRGGQLSRLPEQAAKLFDTARRKSGPAEWALRWVWHHPGVSVVLSGMSNMQQVTENVESANHYGASTLLPDEADLVKKVRSVYQKLAPVPCTGCGYCVPCPNGVAIPQIFSQYNEGVMYDDQVAAQQRYSNSPWAIPESQRPGNCVECRKCEEVCPQKFPIAESLKEARQYLEAGN
ncbi:aldo/keto reductase [Chloroflexota bacterium]